MQMGISKSQAGLCRITLRSPFVVKGVHNIWEIGVSQAVSLSLCVVY